jgi:hypothetical protein
MKTAWELTTIALRVWLFGLLLISFVSLSDFIFRRPHGVDLLMKRLAMGLVWPLALLSSAGRRVLFGKFRGLA